ncbi:SDR family NAD(P)-dependent oxidoreductase [Streptomyces sp. NPDC001137]|uniref:SDR family NAD(P)-dependent oxidoreductase n=1 Tax=Streptomyces sp. NPDC001137 TaxID=3154378 RepID=UPI0033327DFA
MTSRFTGVAEFGEPFLRGRHVLVAGATGGIGEGMTRALLALGATVVAAGRDGGRLRLLADYAGDTGPGVLPTHVIDVSDPDSTAVRAELVQGYGRFDGAVLAIGNWGPPGRTAPHCLKGVGGAPTRRTGHRPKYIQYEGLCPARREPPIRATRSWAPPTPPRSPCCAR